MTKYDGLIIPRSYNDYINKSNPIDVSQALQLSGVMDNAPAAQSTKPAKSGGIFAANAVIMASSATLTGVAISAGSVVRVLFTAALTGSDTTTGLTLTYNSTAYAVKVGKNGALAAFVASEISSGVFKYLQAYTTLELMFDGTQFIIIGNPVVLSSADYTIYADGNKKRIYNINIKTKNYQYSTASNFKYANIPLSSLGITGSVQSFNIVRWGGFNYVPQVFMDSYGVYLSILLNINEQEAVSGVGSLDIVIITNQFYKELKAM